MGMCGGYQMLGKKIFDPHGVESDHREIEGLGLLDIETLFEKEKITCQAEAELNAEFGMYPALAQSTRKRGHKRNSEWKCTEKLKGYEIHMGTSTGAIGLFKVRRSAPNSAFRIPHSEFNLDGSRKGNCWGTYLHGIFDNNEFRRCLLNGIRESKGLPNLSTGADYAAMKEKAIDNLADMVRKHLDIDFIMRSMEL
jgi:adenosylcobyric acid synthase